MSLKSVIAGFVNVPKPGDGSGDVLSSGGLSQFPSGSTTSAQLKTLITDETGSGALVFATSPTLVTPALGTPASGVATNITGTASGLTAGLATSVAGGSDNQILVQDSSGVTTFIPAGTNGQFLAAHTGDLPSWGSLSGSGDALVANTLAQFAQTTSLELKNTISDETGSGSLVFASAPTLVTPVLGIASATTINKMAITAPATSSTLAVADGKTLTASNTLTLAGTDATVMTFPTTSATIARTDGDNSFTGHQTIEGVTSTGATGTGKLVFDTAPTISAPVVSSATASTFAAFDAGKGLVSAVAGTDYISVTGTPTSGQVPVASSGTAAAWATLSTSPTLVSPVLGTATATSINKWGFTAPTTACTLVSGADSLTYTFPPTTSTLGYAGIPISSKSAGYTTVLADANMAIYHPTTDDNARTFTIDSNANVAYPTGTTLTFINEKNTITIAITSDTMTLQGANTTGSRTLAVGNSATAVKVSSTRWIITGSSGLT